MSNKKDGSGFEKAFAELLSAYGFWVHLLQDSPNGQPFDLIAVKDGEAYVFDCKNCISERFALSRIEENQKTSMALWWECGNKEPLFAIHFPFRGIRILSYSDAMELIETGKGSVSGADIDELTSSLEEWL